MPKPRIGALGNDTIPLPDSPETADQSGYHPVETRNCSMPPDCTVFSKHKGAFLEEHNGLYYIIVQGIENPVGIFDPNNIWWPIQDYNSPSCIIIIKTPESEFPYFPKSIGSNSVE